MGEGSSTSLSTSSRIFPTWPGGMSREIWGEDQSEKSARWRWVTGYGTQLFGGVIRCTCQREVVLRKGSDLWDLEERGCVRTLRGLYPIIVPFRVIFFFFVCVGSVNLGVPTGLSRQVDLLCFVTLLYFYFYFLYV
jgi:hypothetical protein